VVTTFRDHDVRRLHAQRTFGGDMDRIAAENPAWQKELEELFDQDARDAAE
jgi:hypothetical protein